MTNKRQDIPAISPQLVTALDDAYQALRANHPELPLVLITIEQPPPATKYRVAWWVGQVTATPTGVYDGRITFSYPYSWHVGDQIRPCALFGGPDYAYGVLTHEAAHALASARGVKDATRQGRYHNAHYRDTAAELGLEVEYAKSVGWGITRPSAALLDRHADHIAAIADSLPEPPAWMAEQLAAARKEAA
jgi:hypothetical protein